MSFWSKLFGKKDNEEKTGGMEDFMTLIRVYFQAAIAESAGITNLALFLGVLHLLQTGRHLLLPARGHRA